MEEESKKKARRLPKSTHSRLHRSWNRWSEMVRLKLIPRMARSGSTTPKRTPSRLTTRTAHREPSSTQTKASHTGIRNPAMSHGSVVSSP